MQITAIVMSAIAHVLFFLMGILFIFSNLRRSTSFPEEVEKGNLKFYRSYGAYWKNLLLEWHVIDHEGSVSGVRKEIITAWDLIQAPSRIASGITFVLYTSGYFLLLFLSKGAIIGNKQYAPLLSPLWLILLLGLVIGNGIGYIIGFWRTRQAAHRKITYADLRQRSISDYRSNLFRWLLGLAVLLNVSLFLVLPYLFSPAPPLAGASTALMFILFITAESIMPRIVTMPRLIVTPDPRVAQYADDLLRALVIAELHLKLTIGMAFLLYIQWLFFFGWLQSFPIFIAVQVATTLLMLLCFFLSGVLRTSDKGHLGGRITGWSWHKLAF